jgi:putative sugar O-methyltransferase
MSTYKGWEAEEKIAIDYLETCRSAVEDDEVFAKFKSLQGYKNILEHVTPRQGSEYLQLAMEMASDALLENLEAFKENDLIGTPDKFSYPETGKISPTTIRYIKNVFEMATLLGESPISRVVEVGGGSGGLCKTLSVVCDFDEYILVDLPEAVKVQEKYINNFPELAKKCKFISCDDLEEVKDVDLFISNYALSECDYDTQINYYDKLVANSKFAYIIYNLVNFNDFYYNKFTDRMSERFEFTTSKDYENTVILAKVKDQ